MKKPQNDGLSDTLKQALGNHDRFIWIVNTCQEEEWLKQRIYEYAGRDALKKVVFIVAADWNIENLIVIGRGSIPIYHDFITPTNNNQFFMGEVDLRQKRKKEL